MNAYLQRHLPDNTDNVQDKLLMILIESKEHLKRLQRSVNQSKEFNKKAQEYLANSKTFVSLSLTKIVMNVADMLTLMPAVVSGKIGS